jgi:hypothetical protein
MFSTLSMNSVLNSYGADVPTTRSLGNPDLIDRIGRRRTAGWPKRADKR